MRACRAAVVLAVGAATGIGCRWPGPEAPEPGRRPGWRQMALPLSLGLDWQPRPAVQGDWVRAALVMTNATPWPLVVQHVTLEVHGACPPLHRDYVETVVADAIQTDSATGRLTVRQHWRHEPSPSGAAGDPQVRLDGSGPGPHEMVTAQMLLAAGQAGRCPMPFQANLDGPIRVTARVRYTVIERRTLGQGVYVLVEGNEWAKATAAQVAAALGTAATQPQRLEVVRVYRPAGEEDLRELKSAIFHRSALAAAEDLAAEFVLPLQARQPSLPEARRLAGLEAARVAYFAPAGVWAFGDGIVCVLVDTAGRVTRLTQDHTPLLKAVGRDELGEVKLSFQPAPSAAFEEAIQGLAQRLSGIADRAVYAVPTSRLVEVLTLAEQHQLQVSWARPE